MHMSHVDGETMLLWQQRDHVLDRAAFAAQAIIGITLAVTGAQVWAAWFVLAIMCIYISAYAWSWGPLGWLYSSEVQPLETRSAGQSITTLVNLMFSFVIGQVTNLLLTMSALAGFNEGALMAPLACPCDQPNMLAGQEGFQLRA